VEFVRRALAEWSLLPVRLVRTRLGVWLLLLLGGLWWLQRGDPAADPVGIAVVAGTLGAVVCAAALAGSKGDRAALAHRLLHPTSPGAIAVGRWLSALCGAALLIALVAGYAAWTVRGAPVLVGAALAGLAAAAAVSACVLALVLVGGQGVAVLAFLWFLAISVVAPAAMLRLGHGSIISLIGAGLLELGPSVWRYRNIATGDLGAAAHAVVWIGVGLRLAAWQVARLGGRRL
jgi:hypothetical protein